MENHSKSPVVIILSDGKQGHINQSLAVGEIIGLVSPGESTPAAQTARLQRELAGGVDSPGLDQSTSIIPIAYKHPLHRILVDMLSYIPLSPLLSKILYRSALTKTSLNTLNQKMPPTWVISTGSSLSSLNLLISKAHHAKSIHIMKAPWSKRSRYDLQIVPKHDHPKPLKNTVITYGAPNRITEKRLKAGIQELESHLPHSNNKAIGVFIGGNLTAEHMDHMLSTLLTVTNNKEIDLLVTVSRRTPLWVSDVLKQRLGNNPHCRLLMTHDKLSSQPPLLIEGILGLSDVIVVTADSISMISEAASSAKKVIVIDTLCGSSTKHCIFINSLKREGYISVSSPKNLEAMIFEKLNSTEPHRSLPDHEILKKALS